MASKAQRSFGRSAAVASLQYAVRKVLGRFLKPGDTIVLAVSGGLDSMVLLDVVSRLNRTAQWRLVVAHFNHRLRGRSSDADAAMVAKAASDLGLELVSGAGDVRGCARRAKVSIEMAARKLRHDFLAETAVSKGARFILTGHHADDQVELFFIRLLRGSGGTGLGGMELCSVAPGRIFHQDQVEQEGTEGTEGKRNYGVTGARRGILRLGEDREVLILRPLLAVSRGNLEEYAKEVRVRFRTDASNRSSKFLRNRIRHELLPFLSGKFHANVAGTVSRVMDISGAEGAFVGAAAREWLEGRRTEFTRLHVALQRRCIFLQVAALGLAPDFQSVEELRQYQGKKVCVAGRELARDEDGTVRLAEEAGHRASAERVIKLTSGKGKVVYDGARICWRVGGWQGRSCGREPFLECFDADAVGDTIILRHWRAGDRMRPIGMRASVKLQDLFTNAKTPRGERSNLLVAQGAGNSIFWVEGLRISEDHKLTEATKRVLRWEWRRGEDLTRQRE